MEESTGRNRLKELEQVITEFQDQLFRFAFYRTRVYDDSQDIVQEVFIKMYRDHGNLNTVTNLKNYLFRSVSNACIDYQRKNRDGKFRSLENFIIPEHLHEKEASHQILLLEEYKRIDALLIDLPIEQVEVIRLKVLDNLSFVEIAEMLDVAVTTVKSRFKYGIEKLKLKLEKTKGVNYEM
jgi:RNA polymerase sigma-70 factor (ECF subfamily)